MNDTNNQGEAKASSTFDENDMDALARDVAQKHAVRNYVHLDHGSYLYYVQTGWEYFLLEQGEKAIRVSTILELENALTSIEVRNIFIPLEGLLDDEIIRKICHRCGVSRAIFKEVKKNEE